MEVPEFKFALREDLKNQEGFLPTKAEPYATGWDVRCAVKDGVVIYPFEYKLIDLGFRIFAPPGWWIELRPRSSSHAKKHLNCLYGVIDETYNQLAFFSCQYIPNKAVYGGYSVQFCGKTDVHVDNEPIKIEFGEKIGQIIPIRRQSMIVTQVSNEEYDKLCKERGDDRGGFGSTDNK